MLTKLGRLIGMTTPIPLESKDCTKVSTNKKFLVANLLLLLSIKFDLGYAGASLPTRLLVDRVRMPRPLSRDEVRGRIARHRRRGNVTRLVTLTNLRRDICPIVVPFLLCGCVIISSP